MKREAAALAGIAAVTTMVLTPLQDQAPRVLATDGNYPDCSDLDRYADQSTSKGYKGLYGWQYTYVPEVPNYDEAASASHFYLFVPTVSFYMVETGWYKGTPADLPTAYPYPKYYSAKLDSTTYPDWNPNAHGDARLNDEVQYELQYVGYDYANERYKWSAYIDDFSSPVETYYHKDLAAGANLSGGEVTGNAASGTQMRASITPRHQIKEPDNTWHNWTPEYMDDQNDITTTCDDPGFTFTYEPNGEYENYDVTGERP